MKTAVSSRLQLMPLIAIREIRSKGPRRRENRPYRERGRSRHESCRRQSTNPVRAQKSDPSHPPHHTHTQSCLSSSVSSEGASLQHILDFILEYPERGSQSDSEPVLSLWEPLVFNGDWSGAITGGNLQEILLP